VEDAGQVLVIFLEHKSKFCSQDCEDFRRFSDTLIPSFLVKYFKVFQCTGILKNNSSFLHGRVVGLDPEFTAYSIHNIGLKIIKRNSLD
jgi:hypothetical protein